MLKTVNDVSELKGFKARTALGLLLASAIGAAAAVAVVPAALPGLAASLAGAEPKAYWYVSRATAFVAFGLLWLSMVFGLLLTGKLARRYPGVPVAFDLHQFTSLLGLAFGMFHALILLGDQYIGYSLAQILLPFNSTGYKPVWVGLGQIGLYTMAIVGLSFYVRRLITHKGWRLIHFASFITFVLVLMHGLLSGTDTGAVWSSALYWTAAGSVLFLSLYRALTSRERRR